MTLWTWNHGGQSTEERRIFEEPLGPPATDCTPGEWMRWTSWAGSLLEEELSGESQRQEKAEDRMEKRVGHGEGKLRLYGAKDAILGAN